MAMNLWPDDSEDEYAPSLRGSGDEAQGEGYSDGSSVISDFAPRVAKPDDAEPEIHGPCISESTSSESSIGSYDEQPRRRKRRRLSAGLDLPQGRPPFKRVPGPFTMEYLGLLNDDIDDAKERVIADPEHSELPASRVGIVAWTGAEKRLFFDALGRLGRDDLPGISSRIGTKSIAEVAHYIRVLQGDSRERIVKNRDAVIKAEIPAAAEISPQCCLALDAAADELSLRQQRYEEKREQQKWEDTPWSITRETAAALDAEPEDRRPPFANLLHLPVWVRLSTRVFMNASFGENNWRYVDEEPPSMRSTALEDFHNLAVSVTRRIVSAALFFAASRIQAKAGADGRTRSLVKRGDVAAAVESLGLARDGGEFWAGCARRLKLDVFDDEDEGDEDGGVPVLSFDEVEDALGGRGPRQTSGEPAEGERETEDEVSDDEVTDSPDSDVESAEARLEAAEEAMEEELKEEIPDEDARQEAQELILHTALDIPPTQRTIEAVMRRVTAERTSEAHADACDVVTSAQEEMKLWDVLKLEPPEELGRRATMGQGRRGVALGGSLGPDWKEGLGYLSRWETTPREGSG